MLRLFSVHPVRLLMAAVVNTDFWFVRQRQQKIMANRYTRNELPEEVAGYADQLTGKNLIDHQEAIYRERLKEGLSEIKREKVNFYLDSSVRGECSVYVGRRVLPALDYNICFIWFEYVQRESESLTGLMRWVGVRVLGLGMVISLL